MDRGLVAINDPTKILFVANRGHHADIGGIQPGLMSPHSAELWQEGVAIETFKKAYLIMRGFTRSSLIFWPLPGL